MHVSSNGIARYQNKLSSFGRSGIIGFLFLFCYFIICFIYLFNIQLFSFTNKFCILLFVLFLYLYFIICLII